jgi:hypothetical protein
MRDRIRFPVRGISSFAVPSSMILLQLFLCYFLGERLTGGSGAVCLLVQENAPACCSWGHLEF